MAVTPCAYAIGQPWYVELHASPGAFAVAQNRNLAHVYVDDADWPGVVRAASDLEADIARVTGAKPARALGPNTILIGTVGHSPVIDWYTRLRRQAITR